MSPERRIDQTEEQMLKELEKGEFVFWKFLNLITPQKAERLGIVPEAPVFVSPYVKEKERCSCGVDFSPIVYHTGLVAGEHYHEARQGGIYHHVSLSSWFKQQLKESSFVCWVAILDPIGLNTKLITKELKESKESRGFFGIPTIPISSEEVNLLQFRAFDRHRELKEGFLVTDEMGINLFPSSTKDHPFITEYGFKIIEDGSVQFFNHSSLTPRSF